MRVSIEDKVRGGLYGIAVGDALGATVEFMSREEIQRGYGRLQDIIGGGWFGLRPGEWTDDTEMTLAVTEGIIADSENPVPYIGQAFLRWERTNPPDIGNTIKATFNNYRMLLLADAIENRGDADIKERWFAAAGAVHAKTGQTAGNGALMRTLPVGIAYRQASDIYRHAIDIARMTHWDIRAGITCAIYSLMVQDILNGEKDKLKAISTAIKLVRETVGDSDEINEIANEIVNRDENNLAPTGYTVDSLCCAMWAFMKAENLEDAVVKAVNLGGDADTIGAIAGGLAGVYWGYKAIPKRWIDRFTQAQRDRLDQAIEGLYMLAK